MKILLKVGGVQIGEPVGRREFASAVAMARQAGHEIILVHGGGMQIRALANRLGIAQRSHLGLRICDAETAELSLMVLGGQVNRRLVQSLQAAGVSAVGLTGADGGSYCARPHRPGGRDLGQVGAIDAIDTDLIENLLAAGRVPVLATIAPLAERYAKGAIEQSAFYNINADQAATPLALALDTDALLLLSCVPGVQDPKGEVIASLTPRRVAALEADGSIHGGMLPKLHAACVAIRNRPGLLVKIASAFGPRAIEQALEPLVGTTIRAEPSLKSSLSELQKNQS